MPKFGDVGREPSDDDGHFAIFMYIAPTSWSGRHDAFYIDDDDPIDKTLIGDVHWTGGKDIEWLTDD